MNETVQDLEEISYFGIVRHFSKTFVDIFVEQEFRWKKIEISELPQKKSRLSTDSIR